MTTTEGKLAEPDLRVAQKIVALAREHVVAQRRVIDQQKANSHDTFAAEQLLSVMLEALALHEEHYEFLQHQLAREAGGGWSASSFETALRGTIERQPYKAVAIALGIGWVLGRTHHPL